MAYGDGDPELAYRVNPDSIPAVQEQDSSQDAANYDTLKSVYKDFKSAIEDIDKWHAFDLEEKASGLLIKQQIHAHALAFDMVKPLFDALESAIQLVDSEFVRRQNR